MQNEYPKVERLKDAVRWMVALIDSGEEMPKPGDEVAEELRESLNALDS